MNNHGEMAEWFKAHAWNACIGATLSWVRIPLSPPIKVMIKFNAKQEKYKLNIK